MMTNAVNELEPLRIYSRHLMHAYRNQRSVFYQPPSEELEIVLEKLVEVDERHRQSHLLRLAEIAWDKGDDERFFELATRVFVRQAGAPEVGRFDLDFQAPGRVLFLVIETLWRAKRLPEAMAWCEAAKEGGYLNPDSQFHNPLLPVVVRRVEATMFAAARDTSLAGGATGPAGGP
jgi:hypothetical protein